MYCIFLNVELTFEYTCIVHKKTKKNWWWTLAFQSNWWSHLYAVFTVYLFAPTVLIPNFPQILIQINTELFDRREAWMLFRIQNQCVWAIVQTTMSYFVHFSFIDFNWRLTKPFATKMSNERNSLYCEYYWYYMNDRE